MALLHLGHLQPFDTRSWREKKYFCTTLKRPWSGYLGGIHQPGYWVSRLSEEWCSTFNVKRAIPCNSATSGLLAACMAIDIKPGDLVYAPVYTMSATAACAKVLGANVKFIDIDLNRYSISMLQIRAELEKPKAIIVTNLFGHPAYLLQLRQWCDAHNIWMIEDNAQGILAKEGDYYAGTIGHLGVFSLNVHKHLQTGEGGVVVTNNVSLADGVMDAINHGELRRGGRIGLNLRMTEPIASLAVAQFDRIHEITENRRELALELNESAAPLGIDVPKEDTNCRSAYYQWAARVNSDRRASFVENANLMGLPLNCGYSPLLSDVFGTKDYTPIARTCEEGFLVTYEICAYNPTAKQRRMMKDVFAKAWEESQ